MSVDELLPFLRDSQIQLIQQLKDRKYKPNSVRKEIKEIQFIESEDIEKFTTQACLLHTWSKKLLYQYGFCLLEKQKQFSEYTSSDNYICCTRDGKHISILKKNRTKKKYKL